VAETAGALTMPVGNKINSNPMTQHMFTGMEITEKGVQLMCDYVAQVREMVKQHLLEPGYFEPTPEWNRERSTDRLWS
jgi:hypothetical protein